jgi:hypothetical protein
MVVGPRRKKAHSKHNNKPKGTKRKQRAAEQHRYFQPFWLKRLLVGDSLVCFCSLLWFCGRECKLEGSSSLAGGAAVPLPLVMLWIWCSAVGRFGLVHLLLRGYIDATTKIYSAPRWSSHRWGVPIGCAGLASSDLVSLGFSCRPCIKNNMGLCLCLCLCLFLCVCAFSSLFVPQVWAGGHRSGPCESIISPMQ